MYHSIRSPKKSEKLKSLHVTPFNFHLQMSVLKLLGYKGVSIKELKNRLIENKKERVVGITFDDGYLNNLEHAAPILNKYSFTATNYIVYKSIGKHNEWDEEKGVPSLKLMDKGDINAWLSAGMDIGSHCLDHMPLSQLSREGQLSQISDSKVALEKCFNVEISDFCYPYGDIDENSSKIVEKYYSTSVTTQSGNVTNSNTFQLLPRMAITYRTGIIRFIFKIFLFNRG